MRPFLRRRIYAPVKKYVTIFVKKYATFQSDATKKVAYFLQKRSHTKES